MNTLHQNAEGKVLLVELGANRRRVSVELADPALFSPRLEMDTTYPPELIKFIAEIKGPSYVCDEIARDEDPHYVSASLLTTLRAYVDDDDFGDRTILDFGCGGGASTAILARAFPQTRIVGVELDRTLLSIARERAKILGLDRVMLIESPGGTSLPKGIGPFDFIIMNAVYEHVLPEERIALMPRLYAELAPGGILFMNETPNRMYHREGHTTNLRFINYLPDRLAHTAVRKWSYRFNDLEWQQLLRQGIRGGTESGVVKQMAAEGGPKPVVLEPHRLGFKDRLDLYFALQNQGKPLSDKQRMRKSFLHLIKRATGITYTHELSLAIQKPML